MVRIHSPLLNKPETPSLAFIFRFIIACGVVKLGDGAQQVLAGLGNGDKKTIKFKLIEVYYQLRISFWVS